MFILHHPLAGLKTLIIGAAATIVSKSVILVLAQSEHYMYCLCDIRDPNTSRSTQKQMA
jgi:hypothetical protein